MWEVASEPEVNIKPPGVAQPQQPCILDKYHFFTTSSPEVSILAQYHTDGDAVAATIPNLFRISI